MLKWLILIYIVIINIAGFFSMLIDKKCAINGNWRLSENLLMTLAVLGSGIGSIIGMYTFRHKTKHRKFTIFMPIISVISYVTIIVLVFIFV